MSTALLWVSVMVRSFLTPCFFGIPREGRPFLVVLQEKRGCPETRSREAAWSVGHPRRTRRAKAKVRHGRQCQNPRSFCKGVLSQQHPQGKRGSPRPSPVAGKKRSLKCKICTSLYVCRARLYRCRADGRVKASIVYQASTKHGLKDSSCNQP